MAPAKPDLLELAFYLRRLREDRAAGTGLTQAALARALGGDKPLAPATVASWENRTAPKLPPRDRMLAYAQFFATLRSLAPPEPALVPVDSFTEQEREEHDRLRDELLRLHAAARGSGREMEVARRSWFFPGTAPITLICPELPRDERPAMASPGDPNYTELLSFGDLDAVVELFGHIRAENPRSRVTFRSAPNAGPDDLSGHVVIVGGIGWNHVAARVLNLARLPVQQVDDDSYTGGDPFSVRTPGVEQPPRPTWSETEPPELLEDLGLLVRMPNPMNSNRTLTVCNGVHSRGVYGAVRSLTDAQLRESNERYLARNFPGRQFGILMRVQIIDGKAMTPDLSNPQTIIYQWSDAT